MVFYTTRPTSVYSLQKAPLLTFEKQFFLKSCNLKFKKVEMPEGQTDILKQPWIPVQHNIVCKQILRFASLTQDDRFIGACLPVVILSEAAGQ